MRRGKPLNPGDKPLRRTPFNRTPTLPEEKAKPKLRRKTGRHVGEKAAREFTSERSGGVCEFQIAGVCLGRATNKSHRLPEGQGGRWLASNLVDACGMGNTSGCHGYVESHRTEAYAKGWLLKRGQDPYQVPVLLWPMGLVLLRDDGTWWQPNPDDLPLPARTQVEDGEAA